MDLLTGKIKPMYFKYLTAAFGSALISGVLICLLPLFAGADAIWFAMPLTELVVAAYVVAMMIKYTKKLPANGTLDHI